MSFYKQKKEKIPFQILALWSAVMLFADNVIINKTIISPGSVVTGNTGIIIDGKEYGNKKIKITYIKKSIPPVSSAIFNLDDIALIIEDGNGSLVYDKNLAIKIASDTLILQAQPDFPYGPKVLLQSDSIKHIFVNGDASIKVAKKLATIYVKGDSSIEISAKQDDLQLIIEGDSSLHITQPIKNLSIQFNGDITLQAERIERVLFKGIGDVVVSIKNKDVKIVKQVDGDFIRKD